MIVENVKYNIANSCNSDIEIYSDGKDTAFHNPSDVLGLTSDVQYYFPQILSLPKFPLN